MKSQNGASFQRDLVSENAKLSNLVIELKRKLSQKKDEIAALEVRVYGRREEERKTPGGET